MTISACPSATPAFLAVGSFEPYRLKGRCYTSPEGHPYSVQREFARTVMLLPLTAAGGSRARHLPAAVLRTWREHKLPPMIRVGDSLVADGNLVTVSSVGRMDGVGTVGLTGRWGFAPGHTHENGYFVQFLSRFLAKNIRLPFDGEQFDSFGSPVVAA